MLELNLVVGRIVRFTDNRLHAGCVWLYCSAVRQTGAELDRLRQGHLDRPIGVISGSPLRAMEEDLTPSTLWLGKPFGMSELTNRVNQLLCGKIGAGSGSVD